MHSICFQPGVGVVEIQLTCRWLSSYTQAVPAAVAWITFEIPPQKLLIVKSMCITLQNARFLLSLILPQNASIASGACDIHIYASASQTGPQRKGFPCSELKYFHTLFFLPKVLIWLKRNFMKHIYAGVKSEAAWIIWSSRNNFPRLQTTKILKSEHVWNGIWSLAWNHGNWK